MYTMNHINNALEFLYSNVLSVTRMILLHMISQENSNRMRMISQASASILSYVVISPDYKVEVSYDV